MLFRDDELRYVYACYLLMFHCIEHSLCKCSDDDSHAAIARRENISRSAVVPALEILPDSGALLQVRLKISCALCLNLCLLSLFI